MSQKARWLELRAAERDAEGNPSEGDEREAGNGGKQVGGTGGKNGANEGTRMEISNLQIKTPCTLR